MPRPNTLERLSFPGHVNTPPYASEATGWTNVTPADMVLDSSIDDNFGATGHPIVDPLDPARIWVPADHQGIWMSTNYGKTFTKRNAPGDVVESGKPWALGIAPNGSYILAANSGTTRCLKSTDGALNFTVANSNMGFEAYTYMWDPSDSQHVIATSHTNDDDQVWESTNGGTSWAPISSTGTGGQTGYAYFGLTSNTIIHVGDGDTSGGNGTRRATGGVGSWGSWTQVSDHRHFHGSHQLYVDRVNSRIYNAHSGGIAYSDNDGVSWTSVSSTGAASIIQAGSTLVAGASYASSDGFPESIQTATYPPGTSFDGPTQVTNMTNGPRGMCVTRNPLGQYVVVTTNWRSGVWRLVL